MRRRFLHARLCLPFSSRFVPYVVWFHLVSSPLCSPLYMYRHPVATSIEQKGKCVRYTIVSDLVVICNLQSSAVNIQAPSKLLHHIKVLDICGRRARLLFLPRFEHNCSSVCKIAAATCAYSTHLLQNLGTPFLVRCERDSQACKN